MVHLYWGEGKGKTTAAMGLALRALGAGQRVVIVQFLKRSSQRRGAAAGAAGSNGLPRQSRAKVCVPDDRAGTRPDAAPCRTEHLRSALEKQAELLILDEACTAWQLEMVDGSLLKQVVLRRPAAQELVLTGRAPAQWMHEAADYETEMRCHRHPYQKGIAPEEEWNFEA